MVKRQTIIVSAALVLPDFLNLSAALAQSDAERVLREAEHADFGAQDPSDAPRFSVVVTLEENGPYGPMLEFTLTDRKCDPDAATLYLSRIIKHAFPQTDADFVYWGPSDALLNSGEFSALFLRLASHAPAQPVGQRVTAQSTKKQISTLWSKLLTRMQAVGDDLLNGLRAPDQKLATRMLLICVILTLLAAHGGLFSLSALWR